MAKILKISGKIDLTENRDFNTNTVLIEVDANVIKQHKKFIKENCSSLIDYEFVRRYENIFGHKHRYVNSDIFNTYKVPQKIPWKNNFYMNNLVHKKKFPWDEKSMYLNDLNIDDKDILSLK